MLPESVSQQEPFTDPPVSSNSGEFIKRCLSQRSVWIFENPEG